MHLSLNAVVFFARVRTASGVLKLRAAFLVEPVLHAGGVVRLTYFERCVRLKIVVRCYSLKLLVYWRRASAVESAAANLAVLSGKIFGAQVYWLCLQLGTERHAVAAVVIANLNVGIIYRCCHGVSLSLLSRSHDAQLLYRTEIKFQDNVFLLVAVLAVYALTVHHRKLIEKMLVQHVSVDHQAEVAAVLNAVERVASAACEIDSGLRIALYEFEFGR